MLDDIWKRGIEISEITNQAGTKLPTVEIAMTETLAEVADRMLQSNVNSVLIVDNQGPVGVINDRDLLKEIVDERKDPLKTTVKHLNYTPLIVLEDNESMLNAMQIMKQKGFKRAAMVKNGQLVGMLMAPAARRAALQIPASVS
jgi:signal-transduction protein with cAMP-binding, CBS, and nucleotidyltransferase domain